MEGYRIYVFGPFTGRRGRYIGRGRKNADLVDNNANRSWPRSEVAAAFDAGREHEGGTGRGCGRQAVVFACYFFGTRPARVQ
jgi:hypothetical protein